MNCKRVRRIWRQEGLQVRARKRRHRAGRRAPGHLAPSQPNQVWAMDFQFDDISRGRRIKILNVTDEFTREALAGQVARHLTARDTVEVLEQIAAERGAPTHIRCDNGPEFIARALQRWCLRRESRTAHIEPGAPWQNPFVESYNGHLRKELLDLELLDSVLEAQVLIDDWREEYNTYRPHQSLGYLTPDAFARRWRMKNDGRVSQQVDR